MLSAIAPGASSSASNPILDLWTQEMVDDGSGFSYLTIAAPFSLKFQIWDARKEDGPVQFFPDAVGGKHSVDLVADRVGGKDGHYAAAWTNAIAPDARGRYQIRWYLVDKSGGAERMIVRDFDVLPAVVGIPGINLAQCYATVSDLRCEGVTANDAGDGRLLRLIAQASAYVERITGRCFTPVYKEVYFNGSGSRAVQTGEPIIALAGVSLGNPPVSDLGWNSFRVYNRNVALNLTDPDDRQDPKIEFVHFRDIWGRQGAPLAGSPLFGVPWRDLYFPEGVQNVQIRAVFGYTDYDGSPTGCTPYAINTVTKLLVIRDMHKMAGAGADKRENARNRWRVTSEKTRDQSYIMSPSLDTPFTGDREIDDILLTFKRPLLLGCA